MVKWQLKSDTLLWLSWTNSRSVIDQLWASTMTLIFRADCIWYKCKYMFTYASCGCAFIVTSTHWGILYCKSACFWIAKTFLSINHVHVLVQWSCKMQTYFLPWHIKVWKPRSPWIWGILHYLAEAYCINWLGMWVMSSMFSLWWTVRFQHII